jgi:hypothetical protein
MTDGDMRCLGRAHPTGVNRKALAAYGADNCRTVHVRDEARRNTALRLRKSGRSFRGTRVGPDKVEAATSAHRTRPPRPLRGGRYPLPLSSKFQLARPMGLEASAGKNPVSHVGKIYSVRWGTNSRIRSR